MNHILHHTSTERQGADRTAVSITLDVPLGDFESLEAGAHLVTQRRGYEHHGIYVGAGKVVHYAGFAGSAHRGPVEEVTLAHFAAGHTIVIRPNPLPKYSRDETVRRARSRLGENRYRLLTNNCEHFCAWCLLGESHSEQVRTCFTHPRTGLHTLLGLCKAFMEAGAKGGYGAAQIA